MECAACRAVEEAVGALLAEVTKSPASRDEINWVGICTTHAWQLAGLAELAGRIAKARLHAAMEQISQGDPAATGRLGRRRVSQALGEGGDCPFCAAMAMAAEAVLEQAVAGAAIPGSLCIPHLCATLARTRGRERVQAVAQMALAQFTILEEELSELIRKSDYRFRGEPRGREATSWTRVAQLLAGAPAVRWSLRREPQIEG
ncbi:MAG: hypothetical protein M1296_06040 [Chloroflexi bacterium]|nr:hypothetical protein [Chloroflexota bacterium]